MPDGQEATVIGHNKVQILPCTQRIRLALPGLRVWRVRSKEKGLLKKMVQLQLRVVGALVGLCPAPQAVAIQSSQSLDTRLSTVAQRLDTHLWPTCTATMHNNRLAPLLHRDTYLTYLHARRLRGAAAPSVSAVVFLHQGGSLQKSQRAVRTPVRIVITHICSVVIYYFCACSSTESTTVAGLAQHYENCTL